MRPEGMVKNLPGFMETTLRFNYPSQIEKKQNGVRTLFPGIQTVERRER
jgi:hypothetical protein